MKALRAFNRTITMALVSSIIGMTIMMLLALSAQVVLRYAFGVTLAWSEELSLLLFTWTVLLSSALGVREGSHVRMVLVLDRLSPRARGMAERGIHAATCAFGIYLAFAGGSYVSETQGMTSAAIAYPLAWLYSAAPVAGVLMMCFSLEALIMGIVPAGLSEGEYV